MKNIIKLILLIFLYSTYSCAWFEQENIQEMNLSNDYNFFYDTNNTAYYYISILTKDGTPLLNNCEEFFISEEYLYAKQFKNDAVIEYYKINNLNKKISEITSKEYLQKGNIEKIIRYKDLK